MSSTKIAQGVSPCAESQNESVSVKLGIGLADRGETITIISGKHRAVLMSASEHSGLMETLHLLSDPTMASDLIGARGTPVSEMTVWHPDEDGEGL